MNQRPQNVRSFWNWFWTGTWKDGNEGAGSKG